MNISFRTCFEALLLPRNPHCLKLDLLNHLTLFWLVCILVDLELPDNQVLYLRRIVLCMVLYLIVVLIMNQQRLAVVRYHNLVLF